MRYKGRLETVYDIEESLLDQVVPKLIIQPIVENAIVHGIEKSHDRNTLYISIIRTGANINIIVRDTGVGMSKEKVQSLLKEPETVKSSSASHTNLGMYAVHKRLKFLYGEDYGLSVQSEEGEGTTVVIRIPYLEDSQKLYEKYNNLLGKNS